MTGFVRNDGTPSARSVALGSPGQSLDRKFSRHPRRSRANSARVRRGSSTRSAEGSIYRVPWTTPALVPPLHQKGALDTALWPCSVEDDDCWDVRAIALLGSQAAIEFISQAAYLVLSHMIIGIACNRARTRDDLGGGLSRQLCYCLSLVCSCPFSRLHQLRPVIVLRSGISRLYTPMRRTSLRSLAIRRNVLTIAPIPQMPVGRPSGMSPPPRSTLCKSTWRPTSIVTLSRSRSKRPSLVD